MRIYPQRTVSITSDPRPTAHYRTALYRTELYRAAAVLALACSLIACGGSQSGAQDASDSTNTTDSGSDSTGDAGMSQTQPSGPDCSDGTCFTCGDGVCPTGAYCDQDASGGAACAWLTECTGEPTCGCVTGVLGSNCDCSDSQGGPTVSCQ